MRPARDRIRIIETSCCGAYEWACQGGQFLILRAKDPEGFEETGRGLHKQARLIWDALIAEHENEHRRKNMSPDVAEPAA
ncbi:hypothetical protein [Nonomuraea pusilla]|uniref:Uncharacterized protein n=1 Tax=Nonomuraea pusilla TaxID=46177 RepID=A0A1H8DVX3_9ACTN|nr:hypothetical protein [Nonomuraea pusilla]SEN11422.1 hypothetical protein SAMN05660976_06823 [Nonomuraea pusilla]